MAFLNRYGYAPKEMMNQRYKMARNNLLLVILFTLINCGLALLGGGTYFLFSAFIPYMLVTVGMDLSGKFPEDYYLDVYGEKPENLNLLGDGFLVVMVVLAVIGLVLYFLAWLLSKNHKVGWLIFALVFFSMDTVATFLIAGLDITMIIDYLFHAWVIFELARGIHVHFKWKNMEEDPIPVVAGSENAAEAGESSDLQDSPILRNMDRDVKNRILAETEYSGHKIVYRRVGKVNELIVDGAVYDEYSARMEMPHELYATVAGLAICVGYNGTKSFIVVNGVEVVSKIRWY